MTIPEIEALAKNWRATSAADKSGCYVADDLAAILLKFLPVVKQALVIREGRYNVACDLGYADRKLFDQLNAAVDELRFGEGGIEK